MSKITHVVRELRKLASEEEEEEVSESGYMYHVTYDGRLSDIAAEGLVPGSRRSIGNSAYNSHAAKGVFLTEFDGVRFWHSKAEDWANHHSDNTLEDELTPVVLRINLDFVFEDDIGEDEIGTKDSGHSRAVIVTEVIDPDAIRVWNGTRWVAVGDNINVEQAYDIEVEEPEPRDEDEEYDEWEDEEPVTYVSFKLHSPLLPEHE